MMSGHQGDRLLTAQEVAVLLGLALTTVRQWTYQRRLPAVRLGARAVRYRHSAIMRLIEAGESAPRHSAGSAG